MKKKCDEVSTATAARFILGVISGEKLHIQPLQCDFRCSCSIAHHLHLLLNEGI